MGCHVYMHTPALKVCLRLQSTAPVRQRGFVIFRWYLSYSTYKIIIFGLGESPSFFRRCGVSRRNLVCKRIVLPSRNCQTQKNNNTTCTRYEYISFNTTVHADIILLMGSVVGWSPSSDSPFYSSSPQDQSFN